MPQQKKAFEAAAKNAAKCNDDGRLADEKDVADALKTRGLSVDTIDLAPFRASPTRSMASSTWRRRWNPAR